MQTITINVDEKLAATFRKKAEQKFGKKKGYLAKAVTEAFSEWIKQKEALITTAFEIMDKGITAENWKYKRRSELYE